MFYKQRSYVGTRVRWGAQTPPKNSKLGFTPPKRSVHPSRLRRGCFDPPPPKIEAVGCAIPYPPSGSELTFVRSQADAAQQQSLLQQVKRIRPIRNFFAISQTN